MTFRNEHRGAATLPHWIDPDELARSGRRLHGVLEWAELGRVSDAGAKGGSPRVEASFRAYREPGGAVIVEGRVAATVVVECQRCLGDVEVPVQGDLVVAVARSGTEAARLQEDFETVELGRDERLSLPRLVEDEILLAVPLVPRHAHRRDCDTEVVRHLDRLSGRAPARDNPFKVLEALRKRED
jgi:uncharacterized protein